MGDGAEIARMEWVKPIIQVKNDPFGKAQGHLERSRMDEKLKIKNEKQKTKIDEEKKHGKLNKVNQTGKK